MCKAVSAFALAGIIVIGLVFNYVSKPGRMFEMTFLSNGIAATILLIGGAALLGGRDIPDFLYLDSAVLLAVVIVICGVYAPEVCFVGRSVILHLVSPILTAVFYAVFCDARDGAVWNAVTALALPTLYYLFMIVYGRVTGGYVYPYFDPNRYNGVQLIIVAGIAAGIILAVSFILMFVSTVINGGPRLKTRNTEARYENNG